MICLVREPFVDKGKSNIKSLTILLPASQTLHCFFCAWHFDSVSVHPVALVDSTGKVVIDGVAISVIGKELAALVMSLYGVSHMPMHIDWYRSCTYAEVVGDNASCSESANSVSPPTKIFIPAQLERETTRTPNSALFSLPVTVFDESYRRSGIE